ncbi:MAG: hypothetical protein MI919_06660 [Holophagales bacterium]|nr:hypothetical protein [Holophagales bacterium]
MLQNPPRPLPRDPALRRPSSQALHRGLILAAVLAVGLSLAPAPAEAYVVVLEDGTQITTAKAPVRQGDQVILTLQNGNEVSYPAADIDFAKTEEVNTGVNLSNARLLEAGNTRQIDRNEPVDDGEKTFAELVAERSGGDLALPQNQARPDAREIEEIAWQNLPKTPAGFVDFMNMRRDPFPDEAVTTELVRYLRGQGNEEVRVFVGTQDSRPMVEILAGSEASVFKALRDSANCLLQLTERFPGVSGLDLLLLTETQVRAGQFSLDPEQASLLATGRIEPPAFFLRYVEF